jgi:phosphoribosylanthranilate isomerase
MTRVKICGITRPEDGETAIELGAAALGFNFYAPSPRYIAPESARQIIGRVPPLVMTVGIFADEPEIEHALTVAGVSAIQLHGASLKAFAARGDETLPSSEDSLPRSSASVSSVAKSSQHRGHRGSVTSVLTASRAQRSRRSFRLVAARRRDLQRYPVILAVTVDDSFDPASLCNIEANAILLDAPHPTLKGGTGRTIDWTKAREATRYARVILAGGLTPENVADAIRQVRPFAVDVASGVESAPGVKDASKLRAFFAAVRATDDEFMRHGLTADRGQESTTDERHASTTEQHALTQADGLPSSDEEGVRGWSIHR